MTTPQQWLVRNAQTVCEKVFGNHPDKHVNNDIGDHVKQGQVLAVIEDPELQAQFDKAQAAVLQASADIEVAKRQLAAMQADLILLCYRCNSNSNHRRLLVDFQARCCWHISQNEPEIYAAVCGRVPIPL
jgi:hypothetical protein